MIPTMMMPGFPESLFMQFGSVITTLMFVWAIYHQYLPRQVRSLIESSTLRHGKKATSFFTPYLDITFDEYTGNFFDRSEVYTTVKTYVSERSPETARKMKANSLQGKSLMLSMAEYEEVSEEYEGAKVWWTYNHSSPKNSTISFYPGVEERRFYKLTFHRRHRQLITTSYLNHVLEEGKAVAIRKRQRKLFINTNKAEWQFGRNRSLWSHIAFKHPARFETLAMEPERKQRVVDDLLWFSNAQEYYEKVGKAWKRGYLLHGPPGTGKSTMVAAIANLLEYDIYDLELAAVKDNIMLKKLLIETSNKAIILIEDIDCSIDLTGKRDTKKEEEEKDSKEEKEKNSIKAMLGEKKKESEVTLSGLLNFIDGIWSACGEERIIIFTTNYIDKLDPALIRKGRMDMHLELSYCSFEAFKVLARNYLDLDAHPLFGEIERLLGETEMTPADVAECLMPKSSKVDVDVCLGSLVEAIEKAKVEAGVKAAEEERKRKEEEAKAKEKDAAEKKEVEEEGAKLEAAEEEKK